MAIDLSGATGITPDPTANSPSPTPGNPAMAGPISTPNNVNASSFTSNISLGNPVGRDVFGNIKPVQYSAPNSFGTFATTVYYPGQQFIASSTADVNQDNTFGQLGSFFGPQVRGAMAQPLNVASDAFRGSAVGANGTANFTVSVDKALAEKQATFGTPEYFSALGNDNPAADAVSQQIAQNGLVQGLRNAFSGVGGYSSYNAVTANGQVSSNQYQSATQSAYDALLSNARLFRDVQTQNELAQVAQNPTTGTDQNNYGIQNIGGKQYFSLYGNKASQSANDYSTVTVTPYVSATSVPAQSGAYNPQFNQNESFLGNGTGDFSGPTVSIRSNYPSTPSMRFF